MRAVAADQPGRPHSFFLTAVGMPQRGFNGIRRGDHPGQFDVPLDLDPQFAQSLGQQPFRFVLRVDQGEIEAAFDSAKIQMDDAPSAREHPHAVDFVAVGDEPIGHSQALEAFEGAGLNGERLGIRGPDWSFVDDAAAHAQASQFTGHHQARGTSADDQYRWPVRIRER